MIELERQSRLEEYFVHTCMLVKVTIVKRKPPPAVEASIYFLRQVDVYAL